MGNKSLARLGSVLALVGGIIMVIVGIVGLVGLSFMMVFESPMSHFFGFGLLAIVLGIIAIVGHKHATELVWAIVLIVIGYVGGGVGGLLVLLGGILGLLSKYIK